MGGSTYSFKTTGTQDRYDDTTREVPIPHVYDGPALAAGARISQLLTHTPLRISYVGSVAVAVAGRVGNP